MKIKTIPAKEAAPDMVLAEDVYSFSGQNIIPNGTVLTNRSITRLKFYSIPEIKIQIENELFDIEDSPMSEIAAGEDDREEEVQKRKKRGRENQEEISENLLDVIRSTKEYSEFNNNVLESARVLEDSLSTFITNMGEDLTSNELLNRTKEIIVMNQNPIHTFHMLQNMRQYDDATFIHCLNVAIICNVFGRWIRMPQEDLDILTLAGLLHDVGKMKIPEEIIKKPGILTDAEYSVVKLHPQRGYRILESMRIDERIKKAALMHHERCDGSGYPDKLVSLEIDEFAKIVAIADIYDAMTSARVYRGPLCPFDVIGVFEVEGYQKFEPKYMIPFLEGIVNSYLNSMVILSDGRRGTVVMNNKNALSRPVVQVGDEFVDLSQEKTLYIRAIV